jgi:hypothetical protein
MSDLVKTIICLAASRKPGGRCIAGKDYSDSNVWIRPVSSAKEDAIDNTQSRYLNGKLAQVLDIIEIPVLEYKPKQHQIENVLINDKIKWVKKGTFNLQDLEKLIDKPASLWSAWNSSYNGTNDRIEYSNLSGIKGSLYLVKVNCTIQIKIEGKEFDNPKKKMRCAFQYAGTDFLLPVTDPVMEQNYKTKTEGQYQLGIKYICVSLGPIHTDNHAYLFVAAVF